MMTNKELQAFSLISDACDMLERRLMPAGKMQLACATVKFFCHNKSNELKNFLRRASHTELDINLAQLAQNTLRTINALEDGCN